MFRRLYFSPNLHLSLERPTTVDEVLIEARPILALEGPLDSLRVTQIICENKKNHEGITTKSCFVPANLRKGTVSIPLNEEKVIGWYKVFPHCFSQESKDQILSGSLMALLAAIMILMEETDKNNEPLFVPFMN